MLYHMKVVVKLAAFTTERKFNTNSTTKGFHMSFEMSTVYHLIFLDEFLLECNEIKFDKLMGQSLIISMNYSVPWKYDVA